MNAGASSCISINQRRESVRHFACTQCGACCNRSPEVELSEATALADVFVFRLMFRMYRLPLAYAQYGGGSSEQFYQSRRLLNAFAAHSSRTKIRSGGKPLEYDKYLIISALTVDGGTGACAALSGGLCSIYERRPQICRAVPFRYSRAEAFAEEDLKAFVETPGYPCDITDSAPVVLDEGRFVDDELPNARAAALQIRERDRRWVSAIVRKMKSGHASLPSLSQVDANAEIGATTVSMGVGWQIAADADIITADQCRRLIERQVATMARCFDEPVSPAARETLLDMGAEYRELLELA